MAEKLLINSDDSCEENISKIRKWYEEYRHLRITAILGIKRSIDQNSMIYEVYTHIASQLYGGDIEHVRAECKLRIGADIVCEDPNVGEAVRLMLDNLSYEDKLKAMKYIDVTSIMSRMQCAVYINRVMDHYSQAGVLWPDYLTKSAKDNYKRSKKAA